MISFEENASLRNSYSRLSHDGRGNERHECYFFYLSIQFTGKHLAMQKMAAKEKSGDLDIFAKKGIYHKGPFFEKLGTRVKTSHW